MPAAGISIMQPTQPLLETERTCACCLEPAYRMFVAGLGMPFRTKYRYVFARMQLRKSASGPVEILSEATPRRIGVSAMFPILLHRLPIR